MARSLYRRYRPQRFGELVGQDHVVTALTNAVRDDRVGQAYLFSGPRGTGKTSTARILAKALNCHVVSGGEPDGTCESCRAIEQGRSLDVFELDAASNRGIDQMKDLLSTVALGTSGRTKVYVLDEVHMLTPQASAALLKTLEEPPDHVVFVLATTDPQKVLPTIRSRTQHYEFRLLLAEQLESHVRSVARAADIAVDDVVVDQVVRRAAGSARDALSALDQVAAGGTVDDPDAPVDGVVTALVERDAGAVLTSVAAAVGRGVDPRDLADGLARHLRDVFLVAVGGAGGALGVHQLDRLGADADRLGAGRAVSALEALGGVLVDLRQATDPRLVLEAALLRLAADPSHDELAALRARLDRLEAELATRPVAGQPSALAVVPPQAPPPAPVDPPSASRTDPQAPTAAAASEAAEANGGDDPPPAVQGDDRDGAPGAPGPTRPGAEGPAADARRALSRQSPSVRPPDGGGSAARPPAPPPPLPTPPAGSDAPAPSSVGSGAPAPPSVGSGAPAPPSVGSDAPAPPSVGSGAPAPPSVGTSPLGEVWEREVVPGLPARARALFGAGRLVEATEDAAAFALPNGPHMARCETVRRDVEAAMGRAAGRPVTLVLMVEGDDVPPLRSAPAGRSAGAAPDDEAVDPEDLVDAPAGLDPVAQLQAAFPGARLVDDTTDE